MEISIYPLPEKIRQIPRKWRPGHPPIFAGKTLEEVTLEEVTFAFELFKVLDAESQQYWGGDTMRKKLERCIEQLKNV